MGSSPITCSSVTHWASMPRGMQFPQAKKMAGTVRPLERGVRRAKLGVAGQGQSLTPEALARYRVPRVALVSVTAPAKRTQGVHGPQCASVKGLSPVMRRTVGADML